MPEHTYHELFGTALWVVLLVLLVLSYPNDWNAVIQIGIIGFIFCFLGSILPDIDERHSVIFRHVRFLVFVLVFVLSYAALSFRYPKDTLTGMLYILFVCFLIAIAAVLFLYATIPAHRKGIHSVAAGGVYSILALACAYAMLANLWSSILTAVFAFFAYLSHLVLDRSIK